MAQLAIPLMLAGTAVSAAGQYQEGQATAAGLKSQADAARAQAAMEQQILNQNAVLKERQATAELERSRDEARKFGREGEHLMASQNVALAKGGVLTSQDTPSNLLEYTARELETDRMQILREGFLNQSFALSEAENLRYQGRASIAQGENIATGLNYQAKGAKRGATYGALGTLLTGFGSAYAMKSIETKLTTPKYNNFVKYSGF